MSNKLIKLNLYVQPGASRSQIAGSFDGLLKIRLAAPPVDGKANEALIGYLSCKLGIAKSRIQITSGLSSRRKTVVIVDTEGQLDGQIERILRA